MYHFSPPHKLSPQRIDGIGDRERQSCTPRCSSFAFLDVILLLFVWALKAKHKLRSAPVSRKPPDKNYSGGEVILRSLLYLSTAAVFTASLVLAISYEVQAGAQGDTQNPPIIRSTTRVINVYVVVTDREGRQVRSHFKDDFQIFDNGRPEKMAFLILACLDVCFVGRSRRQ